MLEWITANWSVIALAIGGLALVDLAIIARRLTEVVAEIRQLRFDLRAELATGGQYTAIATITGELGGIAATLSEIQRRQEQGPWESSEPR